MNSFLILPAEIGGGHQAILSGARARYAFEVHGIRTGQTIKVAILNGMRGEGRIVDASLDRVAIDMALTRSSLDPIPVTLIVGVSRPQTVKKVIQSAVMFGVESLHFVRSELGEKSYLQSRSLDLDQIEEESCKALEQVWDSRAPEVMVHNSFSYLIDQKIPDIVGAHTEPIVKLLAHPGGAPIKCSDAEQIKGAHAVIAIGSERGWSEGEVLRFTQSGFEVVGLGDRVVRVELALVFLLGKLALLRG